MIRQADPLGNANEAAAASSGILAGDTGTAALHQLNAATGQMVSGIGLAAEAVWNPSNTGSITTNGGLTDSGQALAMPQRACGVSAGCLTHVLGSRSGMGSGQDEQPGTRFGHDATQQGMFDTQTGLPLPYGGCTACTGPNHQVSMAQCPGVRVSNREPVPPGSISLSHADASAAEEPLLYHSLNPSPLHDGMCPRDSSHEQHLGLLLGVHDDVHDANTHSYLNMGQPTAPIPCASGLVGDFGAAAAVGGGFDDDLASLLDLGSSPMDTAPVMQHPAMQQKPPQAPSTSPPGQGSDGSGSGSGQTTVGMAMGFPVMDVVSHPLFGMVPQVLCGADVAALTAQAQAHLTRATQMGMSRPMEAHGSLTAAAAAAAIAATAAVAAAAANPDGPQADGADGEQPAQPADAAGSAAPAEPATQGALVPAQGAQPPDDPLQRLQPGAPVSPAAAAAAMAAAGLQPPLHALDSMQQLQVGPISWFSCFCVCLRWLVLVSSPNWLAVACYQ